MEEIESEWHGFKTPTDFHVPCNPRSVGNNASTTYSTTCGSMEGLKVDSSCSSSARRKESFHKGKRVKEYNLWMAAKDLDEEPKYLRVLMELSSSSPDSNKHSDQPLLLDALECSLGSWVARGEEQHASTRTANTPNAQCGSREKSNSGFYSADPPSTSLSAYLHRLLRYGRFGPSTLLLGYIYIHKALQSDELLVLDACCVHRLVLVSAVIAAKFLEDRCCSNAYYAQVGGIPTEELNRLEIDFICRLAFNLFVSPDEMEATAQHLYNCMAPDALDQSRLSWSHSTTTIHPHDSRFSTCMYSAVLFKRASEVEHGQGVVQTTDGTLTTEIVNAQASISPDTATFDAAEVTQVLSSCASKSFGCTQSRGSASPID
mmetsp:Transcript_35719/g.68520  ORF Transcript_35719/g.68520 Transcript_35719/m.68520 type:complete len:375 (-) Transcript_35719:329-1453(-)|eukprot:CAMPEP_0114247700 /NCGR_PEP_ID=MMETSP0058-20121206/13163_1 /TAXON_ID=36894 /ORGANISM="Pyramimonas parkeae, CCMP726" /LENGTH=374 /DNA_ID=CAMNT_0001361025 /DNA_START=807 /DNA_END=1931 /DNA_ORIENTATION=-